MSINYTRRESQPPTAEHVGGSNARRPAGPGSTLGRAAGPAQTARRAAGPAQQQFGRSEARSGDKGQRVTPGRVNSERQAKATHEDKDPKVTSGEANGKITRKERRANYLQSLKSLKSWQRRNAEFGPRHRCQGINFVSWNCDSIANRHRTTAQYLDSKNLRVVAMQETKEADFVYKNQGKYTYISTAALRSPSGGLSGGVGLWIHHSCKVLNYEVIHRNILKVEIDMQGEHILALSAYAPQDRVADPEKFWSTLKSTVEDCNKRRKVMIGIDANGRLGMEAYHDFNEVGPGAIHDKTTHNGNKLLKVLEGLGYKIQNTFFKLRTGQSNHTFERGSRNGITSKSQIDFVITKGFGFDRSGWSVQDCRPAPLLTMNKLDRTHIPVLARLHRIHVHRVKSDAKSKDYAKKIIAMAVNEEAEDARNKPSEWGNRGQDLEDDENGESTDVVDEEKERIKALEVKYQKELDDALKQTPEETARNAEFSKKKINLKSPDERAKRRVQLKTFRTETRKIHSENPSLDWDAQAERVTKLAQVCFPKVKVRQTTWHGVAVSEKTAKIHDEQCQLEEKLVNTIKFSPQSPTVFLRIQKLKGDIILARALYEKSADEDVQTFYLERAKELDKGNIQERDSKMWALVQTILKKQKTVRKKKSTHILNNAKKKCWTPDDKANAFGEFIKDNFTEGQQFADTDDWWATILEQTSAQVQDEPDKNHISKDTRERLEKGLTWQLICQAIKSMARNKADGPDAMAVEIFQADPVYWAKRLLKTFTNPPELHQLEDGRVAYIFKNKGETYERTFYRPIAVLNAAYKIWAAAQTLLMAHVVDDVMSISQAGFRTAHGTRDALCWNQNIINRVQEKLLSIGYLDMSKAFDRAIRKKIWERLIKIGCPKSFVSQLRDGHINSHLRPSFEGAIGDKILVSRGVYQGSPLSPVLFIIYSQAFNLLFEDECAREGLLPVEVSTTKRWPTSQKPWEKVYDAELEWLSRKDRTIRFMAYADDTVLPARSLEELKKAITAFERACAQFGMEINKGKTEIQSREVLSRNDKTALNQGFLGAKPGVDCVSDNVRILGAYSNINGFTRPAVGYRMNIVRKIWGMLRKPFFQVKAIKMRTRLLVYQALIVSSLMFGMEAFDLSQVELHDLQTFQNKCLRDIYDTEGLQLRKHVFGDANVVVPTNRKIQEACQVPTIASRYKWQILSFTTHWVRKPNLSTMVSKFKFTGETDPPKQGIKNQAKGKGIDISAIMEELEYRYKTYQSIICDSKWYDPTTTHWDAQGVEKVLLEEGFCDQEKVCTLFPGAKLWDPAAIGVNFLQASVWQEEWIKTLQHNVWKGLIRLLLHPFSEVDEDLEDGQVEECLVCKEVFKGKDGISKHLARQDWCAKKADPNCVTCLDTYATLREDLVMQGPLTVRQQGVLNRGHTPTVRQRICPWGHQKCTPGETRGWWCIICRRKANSQTIRNRKDTEYHKDYNEVRKFHLKTKNQMVLPHAKAPVTLSCTNPKKPKTCKFPDKTRLWCAHCRKKTKFTPQANTDKNNAQNLARQNAKRDIWQGGAPQGAPPPAGA